ncbi:MAG: hypothetical protein M1833_002581 [Piccolia ochrophora]|nr:MAG: hypothetical protein M1833_002581 [Piccolia ochrophora]
MRLLPSVLFCGTTAVVSAAAQHASIYGLGHELSSSSRSPSLTPGAARLLLSQQLGVSQFHRLDEVDQTTIKQLNDYGRAAPLLAEDEAQSTGLTRTLVFVEGVENADDLTSTAPEQPSFHMSDPPNPSANDELAQDLVTQLVHSVGTCRTCISSKPRMYTDAWMPEFVDLELFRQQGQAYWCSNGRTVVIYVSVLDSIAKTHGTSSKSYKEARTSISRFLSHLPTENRVTVLFPVSTASKIKRSATPYGTYNLPRSVPRKEDSSPSQSSSATSTRSRATSSPSKQPTKFLTLPSCFASSEACVEATKNCSGHGSCGVKYRYPSSDPSKSKSSNTCYVCQCAPSHLQDSDTRKKTIYWGGKACQKKDVSAPFWLIAGFSVFLIAAVSWGVGLLMGIGEEKLPGVLGAGVGNSKQR